jgi:peptidoglycan/LPS O-acetylase OafA/YrhL
VSRPGAGRIRLGYLDGLRGLAALYVLLYHELTISLPNETEPLSAPMRALRAVFGYGHYAVCVFIVLSGFSLMLPVVQSGGLHLPHGFRPYLRRRVRRLFPPYYAALALSLIAVLAATHIPRAGSTDESYEAALRPGSIVSHVLLVHNWDFDWVYRINGPMWSVATEWQIYFLFPLLLLPLWRRIGGLATVVLAWSIPVALDFGLSDEGDLSWAAPWFVGSFALGMWGATAMLTVAPRRPRSTPTIWGGVAILALGCVVATVASNARWQPSIPDLFVSLFALGLIMSCATRVTAATAPPSGLAAVFASRPLVLLGGFSYSLYLLQHPLLRLTESVLGELPFSYEQLLLLQLVVGTPLVLAASWLFAEIFELPFTTGGHFMPAIRRRLRQESVVQPASTG